jgi:LacI family transcriptional regulator
VARGIATYGQQFGGWIVEAEPFGQRPQAALASRLQAQAFILMTGSTEEIDKVRRTSAPAVIAQYHTEPDHCPTLPRVVPDEEAMGRLAAEHLRSRGFRSFSCLSTRWAVGRLRQRGFIEHLWDHDHQCVTLGDEARAVEASGLPAKVSIAQTQRLVRRVPKPCGVFAFDDAAAAEIVHALLRGDDPHNVVPNGRDHTWLVAPRGVVSRQSTAGMAVDDAATREALEYMRQHACKGIGIARVYRAVNISRRGLERKVKEATGRSPAEELRRLTDLSLIEIALSIGFASQSNFTQALAAVCGTTPGRWRG